MVVDTRRLDPHLLRKIAEVETGVAVSLRDSFFLKIALASLNGQGTRPLIHRQREEHLSALAELGRLQGEPKLNPATELLLEGAMLRLEADLKWLDVCEERLKA